MLWILHAHYHQWLSHYGYAGLFVLLVGGIVGAPVPDETLMTVAGVLAAKGELLLAPTWVAAFLGSACGITVSFVLGRTLGAAVLTRYGGYVGITPARLERTHQWFEHLGRWTLLIGYFVPGVRHFTAVVAGMSKLDWFSFAVFAYAGAALWVSTFIFIGYFVGDHWKAVVRELHDRRVIAAAVAAGVLVLLWLARRFFRSKSV